MSTSKIFYANGLKVKGDTLLNGANVADTACAKLHVKTSANGASANLNNINGLLIENSGSSNSNYAFKIATGAGNVFNVSNGGRVGIGVTNPNKELTVVGDISATGILNVDQLSTTGCLQLDSYGTGALSGTTAYYLTVDSSGNVLEEPVTSGSVGGAGNQNFVPKWSSTTNLTDSLIYDDGTNVGIDTQSPNEKLTVSGSISSNDRVCASSFRWGSSTQGHCGSTSWDAGYASMGATTGNDLRIGANGSTKVTVKTSGKVGVGTLVPTTKLHVLHPAVGQSGSAVTSITKAQALDLGLKLSFSGGDNSDGNIIGGIALGHDGEEYAGIYAVDGGSSAATELALFAGDTNGINEAIRIDSGGNVGIGVTNPDFPLEVAGAIGIDDYIYHNGDHNTYLQFNSDAILLRTGGQDRLKISNTETVINDDTLGHDFRVEGDIDTALFFTDASTDRVGIGTITPQAKFEVTATSHVSSVPTMQIYHRDYPATGDVNVPALNVNVGLANDELYRHGYVVLETQFTGGSYDSPNLFFKTNKNSSNHKEWWGVQAKANSRLSFSYSSDNTSTGAASACPDEVMSIDTSGNVGIGTTEPGSALDVNGTLKVQNNNSSSNYMEFTAPGSWNVVGSRPIIKVGGTEKMRASANGVNIGGSTDASHTLDVDGDIDVSGYINLAGGSSSRMCFNSLRWAEGSTSSSGQLTLAEDYALAQFRSDLCVCTDLSVAGDALICTDLTVNGNLTVQGTTTTLNTEVCTTSAMEITNAGTGPALVVNQTGAQPVIDFQDDGSSTFYIEDGGNVGVGTNNPDRKLHVFISDTGVTPDANSNLVIEDNDSNNFINVLTNNTSQGGIFFGDSDDSNIAGMLYSHSDDTLRFRTNNTNTRLSITSGGYVGVGTDNPQTKLQIDSGSCIGTIDSGYSLSIRGDGIDGIQILSDSAYQGRIIFGDQDSKTSGRIDYDHSTDAFRLYTNGTEKVSILSGGKVGIGTPSPDYELEVSTSSNSRIAATSVTNSVVNHLQADSSGAYVGPLSNHSLFIKTNNTTKMTILNGGNVGIGNVTPNEKLTVSGNVSATGCFVSCGAATQNQLEFKSCANGNRTLLAGSSNGSGFLIGYRCATSSVSILETYLTSEGSADSYIGSSSSSLGNFGIGTATPNEKLTVSGNISASGVIYGDTFCSNSGSCGTIDFNDNLDIDGYITATQDISSQGCFYTSSGSNVAILANNYLRSCASGTFYFDNATVGQSFQFRTSSSSALDTTAMTITSAGYVGLGVLPTNQRLTLNGNFLLYNNKEIRQLDTDGLQRTIIKLDSSNDLNIGGSYSGALKFIGGGSYSEVMRIHDDGNVGIGIIDPDEKLEVDGNIKIGAGRFYRMAGDAFQIGIDGSAVGMRFYADSTERMTILSGGNVGIGTTEPSEKLHLYASLSGAPNFVLQSNAAAGQEGGGILFKNTANYYDLASIKVDIDTYTNRGDLVFATANTSTPIEAVRILGVNQNVGIGDDQPSNKLVVVNSDTDTTPTALLQNSSTGDASLHFNVSGRSYTIGIDNSDDDKFKISRNNGLGTTDRLTIDGDGNVGIGTTSPGYKLDVATSNGDGIKLNHSDGWPSIVLATKVSETVADSLSGHSAIFTTTPNTNGNWPFNTANGEYGALVLQSRDNGNSGIVLRTGTGSGYANRLVVRESGNVGIGTTDPQVKLEVRGDGEGINLCSNDYMLSRLIPRGSGAALDGGLFSLFNTGTECVRIDSGSNSWFGGGYVGIGTNVVNYPLEVTRDNGGLISRFYNTNANGEGVLIRAGDASCKTRAFQVAATDDTKRFTINSDGTVGIGVTNPSTYALEIHSDISDAQLRIGSPGTWSGINFCDCQGSGNLFFRGVSCTWSFGGGGSSVSGKRIHVDGGATIGSNYDASAMPTDGLLVEGDVGIGTEDPNQKLEVFGNQRISNSGVLEFFGGTVYPQISRNSSSGGLIIDTAGGGVSNSVPLLSVRENGGTDFVTVLGNGNVGIGTASPDTVLHAHSTGLSATFANVAYFRSGPDENATGSEIFIGQQGNSRGLIIQGGRGGEGAIADDNAVAHFCLNRSGGTIPSSTQDHIMTFRQGGFVGIGTTEPGTNTGKLFVGTPPITGSAAIAQFGGFVRGNFFITHDSNYGIYPNTTCTGQVGKSDSVYNCAHIRYMVSYGEHRPDVDNCHTLGTATCRWSNVHAACTTTGAVIESNLCTSGIDSCPKGSVVVWRDGKLQGTTQEYDYNVMGVTATGSESPIVMGAEPILITGDIKEGDPIVTSCKINHGMRGDRNKDLHGKVIAQALENGSGDSYTIMGMVRKF